MGKVPLSLFSLKSRMPLGESRFDVAKRVHDAFGTFHRDAGNGSCILHLSFGYLTVAEQYSIEDLIIVTHGVTLRLE